MEIVKNENATELFTKTQIENTPFLIIHNKEKNIAFGVFGRYKITRDYNKPEEVESELTKFTWDKIITVMTLVHEMLKNESIEENKNENV